MGGHYVKSGMQKEAIGYFQRALEINRYGNYVNRAATEFNLGNCYLDEGLYDIAFDYYRKSIQTRMWYGQPFSGIAEILLRRGYTDLARHFALLAMEIQPDHVQFRELLILILLKEGNIDRAGKEISKLLQQDSGRKTHLFFLAEIQYRKGRKDRAVYYLRELIKTNPQFIPAYLFLIELYDAEDDKKSLQETIASLMYLKEDKNIENVVCMDNGNIFASAHATDSKKILSIIKKNLIYQAQNIKGECQNNKRHFLK
jgi:tetratricopeptide (TPR) repeat protein